MIRESVRKIEELLISIPMRRILSMSQKFVITGGAGFIGSNLAEALCEENEVAIIDDLSTGKIENIAGQKVRLFKGSIEDFELLRSAFEGAECVFHLAAIASVKRSVEDPLQTNNVGINGTLNVLTAARDAGVRRVVLASSAAVYGNSPDLPKREDMIPEPRSPYAVSKLAGEHYARVYNELYGLETVMLRYFNVFGPKQDPSSEYSGVISRFVSAILDGDQPTIFGDGEQTRDFVFVSDVVAANILAGRSFAPGIYNIANEKSTSLNQLAQMIGKIVNKNIMPRYEASRPADIKHSLASIDKAKIAGYHPIYSIEEGLARTIQWYRGSLAILSNDKTIHANG